MTTSRVLLQRCFPSSCFLVLAPLVLSRRPSSCCNALSSSAFILFVCSLQRTSVRSVEAVLSGPFSFSPQAVDQSHRNVASAHPPGRRRYLRSRCQLEPRQRLRFDQSQYGLHVRRRAICRAGQMHSSQHCASPRTWLLRPRRLSRVRHQEVSELSERQEGGVRPIRGCDMSEGAQNDWEYRQT